MSRNILVLEDDESLRLVMTRALARVGYEVRATASLPSLDDRLAKGEVDLLIADVVLGQDNFLDHIEIIRSQYPDLPIIVVSAQTTARTAIHSAIKGATEYLPKPFDLDDLIKAVDRALGSTSKRSYKKTNDEPTGLIGQSASMQPVFKAIGTLSKHSGPVLITGREGTGRALVARILHEARGLKDLKEAGPARLRDEGPTLFSGQADGFLLRRYERWDDLTKDRVQEFLESSDNRPAYVTAKTTPSDPHWSGLTHQLGVSHIQLPSLKDRSDDIERLFQYFIQGYDQNLTLKPDAKAFLKTWSWPGEIFEIRGLADRIIQEKVSGPLTRKILKTYLRPEPLNQEDDDWSNQLALKIKQVLSETDGQAAHKLHDDVDRQLIRAALATHGGVRKDAAESLGWNRNTLARRMKSLNMTGQNED